MHESHTLIVKEEDEGEEVLKKLIKKHRGNLGDEINSSVEVIEFLEIPIGSPRAPRARIGANMTLVSPQWLNDGGLGSNDGVKKVKRKG